MFRREGEYKPPGKLIRVSSPKFNITAGVMLFFAGVLLLAVSLTIPTRRTRRHPEDPRLRRVVMVAVTGIVAAAGVGIFVVGYQQGKLLVREGLTAQAEVIGRWWKWWAGRGHHYFVAYEFVVQLPDGSTATIRCQVNSKRLYDQLKIGDKFVVRYLPSNLTVGECEIGNKNDVL